MQKTAVYPGSFDPVTNGHLDIIERGLSIFDKVIVVVMYNPAKKSCFSVEDRVEMLSESTRKFKNVIVDKAQGLTVEYAVKMNASAILRGMRATSDFEYEFQLALINRKLQRKIETVFFMTGFRWIFTSSSIIKEAGSFGANIDDMVPEIVAQKNKRKVSFELRTKVLISFSALSLLQII